MTKQNNSLAVEMENEELFDALFGSCDEMSDEEVDMFLQAHGIDEDDLISGLGQKMAQEASKRLSKGNSVPPPLQNALKNFKENHQRASAPPKSQPDTWINNLLNGIFPEASFGEMSFAFKGKKDGALSSKDQELLASLEDEVNSKSGEEAK